MGSQGGVYVSAAELEAVFGDMVWGLEAAFADAALGLEAAFADAPSYDRSADNR